MESTTGSTRYGPHSPADGPPCGSMLEFEQRLYRHCALACDDGAFWDKVAHDVLSMQAGADASEHGEIASSVDALLSRLGLQSWTIVNGGWSVR